MDLSLREVAALLSVPEATVYRWAREGVLPAYRLDDQYRFNRVELQEWAAAHRHQVAPALLTRKGRAARSPNLCVALSRGGIHRSVGGADRDSVLEAVSRLRGIPEAVDRELLCELLVRREVSFTSGIGGGIALPHARDPLVVPIDEPVVLLCFLAGGVDFHAVDGQPVRVLFTVLTPTIHSHLQILAKLAFVLHDASMKSLLVQEAADDAILERVRALEEQHPESSSLRGSDEAAR